jgi:nitronate monooxygenase
MILDGRRAPIVLAPLAGGPSTPALTAAVSNAGGFGFLAAGYLSADEVRARMDATRELTSEPFGVNLFVPGSPTSSERIDAYVASLADESARAGVALGDPRFDDDDWDAKLDVLCADRVAAVSFAFGRPSPEIVTRLHGVGSEVWVTVTGPDEAVSAVSAGADVLVVQGGEAGGHRGGFTDDDRDGIGLLPLLQLVRARVDAPMVAAGGIGSGAGIAAVLAAGARAAALGTAFLRCAEAGTSPVHRDALARNGATALTRAFTGRAARGLRNRFMAEHPNAPAAYPEIHHLTAPVRAAGRAAGDPDVVNLWAGQAFELTRAMPAGDLVRALHAEARAALDEANRRV